MVQAPPARFSERQLQSRPVPSVRSLSSSDSFNLPQDGQVARNETTRYDKPYRLSDRQFIKWGIAWYAPTLMALYMLGGMALAIGHHFYFSSLHGTVAGSSQRQQWAIGFGTALSFLIVALLRSATSAAYSQYVWIMVRRTSYQIGTLDKLFALTTDPSGFFGVEMFKAAKLAVLIALISWS